MARAEIVRDHTGTMTLRVAGDPVHGAVVNGIFPNQTGVLCVQVSVPVRDVTFADADNVLAFRRDAKQS